MSVTQPAPAKWLLPVLAGLAVTSFGVAGYGAYQAPAVRIQEQKVEEPELTVKASFEYDVELTAPTSVWPKGTRLEADRALYSFAGEPVLRVRPFVEATSPGDGGVAIKGRTVALIKGLTTTGQPLWQVNYGEASPANLRLDALLPTAKRQSLTEMTLPINPIRKRMLAIREELGFAQSAHDLAVAVELQVSATVAGKVTEFPLQATLPFHFDGQGFSPEPLNKVSVAEVRKRSLTLQKEVPVSLPQRMLQQQAWLGAGAVFLLGIPLCVYYRKKRTAGDSPEHPEHRRFKDWITEGKVNPAASIQTHVGSLAGLVDLAIDMNKRVIFDRKEKAYHVLDGDILYTFKPEGSESAIHGKSVPLGKILVQSGVLTSEALNQALDYQRTVKRPLGECLIALDILDEITIYTTLAAQAQMPYREIGLEEERLNARWLERLTVKRARLFGALPLGERPDGKVAIALASPLDQGALAAVSRILEVDLVPVATRPSLISLYLDEAEHGRPARAVITPERLQEPATLTELDRALLRDLKSASPIPLGLILKAAGFVPEESLVHFRSLDTSVRHAMMESGQVRPDALQMATGAQRWKNGDLIDLLRVAGRLPDADAALCRRVAEEKQATLKQVLISYQFASPLTLQRAERILSAMKLLNALSSR